MTKKSRVPLHRVWTAGVSSVGQKQELSSMTIKSKRQPPSRIREVPFFSLALVCATIVLPGSALASPQTNGSPQQTAAPQSAPAATPAATGTPQPVTKKNSSAPAKEPDRATAYYHFGLAHMYEEMATNYGRPEYATRAIEEYKLALDADPGSKYLNSGLAELYLR